MFTFNNAFGINFFSQLTGEAGAWSFLIYINMFNSCKMLLNYYKKNNLIKDYNNNINKKTMLQMQMFDKVLKSKQTTNSQNQNKCKSKLTFQKKNAKIQHKIYRYVLYKQEKKVQQIPIEVM